MKSTLEAPATGHPPYPTHHRLDTPRVNGGAVHVEQPDDLELAAALEDPHVDGPGFTCDRVRAVTSIDGPESPLHYRHERTRRLHEALEDLAAPHGGTPRGGLSTLLTTGGPSRLSRFEKVLLAIVLAAILVAGYQAVEMFLVDHQARQYEQEALR